MTSTFKYCHGCNRDLPVGHFYKNRAHPSGLATRCKDCDKAYSITYRYGISIEEYQFLVSTQAGLCAICKRAPIGPSAKTCVLHVDHDHETGYVRGLLCTACNRGLGLFGDSIERLQSAISYLEGLK